MSRERLTKLESVAQNVVDQWRSDCATERADA